MHEHVPCIIQLLRDTYTEAGYIVLGVIALACVYIAVKVFR